MQSHLDPSLNETIADMLAKYEIAKPFAEKMKKARPFMLGDKVRVPYSITFEEIFTLLNAGIWHELIYTANDVKKAEPTYSARYHAAKQELEEIRIFVERILVYYNKNKPSSDPEYITRPSIRRPKKYHEN